MKPIIPMHSVAILLVLTIPLFADTVPSAKPATAQAAPAPGISIETHFSPEEKIAPIVVNLIDGSQQSLDIAAFAFTHPKISEAVIRAKNRGVTVRMVTDLKEERSKTSRVPDLKKAGIDVLVRRKRGVQHNKYMVIDQKIVITGSFNFTITADARNTENMLVIRNAPQVVKAFMDDYEIIRKDLLPMK